jgi:DNA polymerase III alpha subunit
VVEQRIHHQVTGEPMKFLSLADWTGIIETELFAKTYRSYGLATVRYPVLEIEASVEPFENGRGFTLRALAARRPRLVAPTGYETEALPQQEHQQNNQENQTGGAAADPDELAQHR